jgi:hypothetical protein
VESLGLRSTNMLFIIFPDQHSHQTIYHGTNVVSFKSRVRIRLPSPSSLKQPEDVVDEKWYNIPIQTLQQLI